MHHDERDLLGDITNTLHLSKLVSAQQIDVHIDAFLHRRDFGVYPTDVEEGLCVAPAQDCCEAFAEGREARNASSHLRRMA